MRIASGTAAGQGLVVLAAPLLTRLYTPTELGQLGLYVAFLAVAGVSSTWRYDMAIVAAVSPRSAATLSLASGAIVAAMAIPVTLAMLLLVELGLGGYQALPRWIAPLAGVGVILTGWFSILRNWTVRAGNFGVIGSVYVTQNGGRVGTQLGLGALNWGLVGLVVGETVGRALGLWRMLSRALPTFRGILRTRVSRYRAELRRYSTFPRHGLPSALADVVNYNLPLPFVAALYGPAAAGLFALVQRAVSGPMSILSTSVGDVVHHRMGEFSRHHPEEVRPFLLKSAGTLLLIASCPGLVLAIFGPRFFGPVFGNAWELSGSLAAAMVPWMVAQTVVSPLSRVVYVVKDQRPKWVYDFVALVLSASVFFLGRRTELSLVHFVGLLSAAHAFSYLVYFGVLMYIVRRSFAEVE